MPKLMILSDLHLPSWGKQSPPIVPPPGTHGIILAGDVDRLDRSISFAASLSLPVFLIAGNHEHFSCAIDSNITKARVLAAATDNVTFLENGATEFMGALIIGATLWTDLALFEPELSTQQAMIEALVMNDYKKIRIKERGYAKLRPLDTQRFHRDSVRFIREQLALPFAGPKVVVTHMAPSRLSVSPEFAEDLATPCYASSLDGLVSQADYWIHAHMHSTQDYKVGKCRVICNARGHMSRKTGQPTNTSFDPQLAIDI